ncbi:MAG: hypothetical protein ACOVKV_11865 [Novosphingobium sp.]
MTERFTETTDWQGASWAFTVWAAHFSVLWGASSMFPGMAVARWIALFATLSALGALLWLWRIRQARRGKTILLFAIGISALSILFGAMPALIG